MFTDTARKLPEMAINRIVATNGVNLGVQGVQGVQGVRGVQGEEPGERVSVRRGGAVPRLRGRGEQSDMVTHALLFVYALYRTDGRAWSVPDLK